MGLGNIVDLVMVSRGFGGLYDPAEMTELIILED